MIDFDLRYCVRCGLVLRDVQLHARYCPRCGDVVATPAVVVNLETDELERRLDEMANRPDLLSAYAKALLGLSRKYEQEDHRSAQEARRCFLKAEKLMQGWISRKGK